MRDVNVPRPNPALARILLDAPMRRLVQDKTEQAQAIYREIGTRRTGRTARDARTVTYVGGRNKDRWYGRLIVTTPTSMRAAMGDLNQVLNSMAGRR